LRTYNALKSIGESWILEGFTEIVNEKLKPFNMNAQSNSWSALTLPTK